MSVTVYGRPGGGLEADGAARYGENKARVGVLFERWVAGSLESWLAATPGEYHLFHDLTGFGDAEGHGFGPVNLGGTNIDHVVLAGRYWLMVNSKATGKGSLSVDEHGRGQLVRPDGATWSQRWLDQDTAYSHAGILVRLTGLRGRWAWVVADYTLVTDPRLELAPCLWYGPDVTAIVSLAQAREGALARLLPPDGCLFPSADPAAVEALSAYVWDKDAGPALAARPATARAINYARGERHPRAKLNPAKLEEAKAMRAAGLTEREIGEHFSVAASTVHRALSGQSWRPPDADAGVLRCSTQSQGEELA